MDVQTTLRTREIRLRGPHPGLSEHVLQMLAEVPGIHAVECLSSRLLRVRYDLRSICLRGILQILESWGLHLDASLWSKLRYALAFYSEDAQRETLQLPISQPEAMRELAAHIHARHTSSQHHHGDAWERYL